MFYFKYFPKVDYTIDKFGNTVTATDITKRFRIVQDFMKNQYVFYTYQVKEGERANMIAHKYYGDIRLDWLIFMINGIQDPLLDWPLDYYEMENLIRKEHGSLEVAKQTIQEYYQITNQRENLIDGTILPERKVIIDETKYLTLADQDRSLITCYDFMKEANEAKRNIKLVDKSYVPVLISEFKKVFG